MLWLDVKEKKEVHRQASPGIRIQRTKLDKTKLSSEVELNWETIDNDDDVVFDELPRLPKRGSHPWLKW